MWAEPFVQTCRCRYVKEQWLGTVDTQCQSPSTFLDMGPPSRPRTFPVQGAVFTGIQGGLEPRTVGCSQAFPPRLGANLRLLRAS